MRGQADLLGEIHEDEIIKIAWQAVEKRGYAIYADYNEHMKQLICEGRLEEWRAVSIHHQGTFGRRWMGAYPERSP